MNVSGINHSVVLTDKPVKPKAAAPVAAPVVTTEPSKPAVVSTITAEKNATQYDQPQQHENKAVNAYLNIANNRKREELANMLGVDVYA